MQAHVRAIAASAGLPVVLYDVPSRAGVAISNETVARLFEDHHIQAFKDATGDLSRPPCLRALCGCDLPQLSGDDTTAVAHLAMGGVGCVSVTANVFPALCAALQNAWAAGDLDRLAELRDALAPLNAALFTETNPVPIKAALALLKLCESAVRLPLTRATEATSVQIARAMAAVTPLEETHARASSRLSLRVV
jgi:4-hydroxy-tetrahydrodipicolinate synthase